jgi:hypothetical protein
MSNKLDDDFLDDDDFLNDDMLLDDDALLDDDLDDGFDHLDDPISDSIGSDDLDELDDDLESAIDDDLSEDGFDEGIEEDFSDTADVEAPKPASKPQKNNLEADKKSSNKKSKGSNPADVKSPEPTDKKKEKSKLLTLLILTLFIVGMGLLAYILLAPSSNDNYVEVEDPQSIESAQTEFSPTEPVSEITTSIVDESDINSSAEQFTGLESTSTTASSAVDMNTENNAFEPVPETLTSTVIETPTDNIAPASISTESSEGSDLYASNVLSDYVTIDALSEKASNLHDIIKIEHANDMEELKSKTEVLIKNVSGRIIKIANKSDKAIKKSLINKTERAFSMISSVVKKVDVNKKNDALNIIKFKKQIDGINVKIKTSTNEQSVVISDLLTRISSLEGKIKELEISSSDNMARLPTFELLGFDAQKMTVWLKDEFGNVIKTTEGTFIPQYGIVKQITEEGIVVTNVGYVKTK